jgi:hypothetical protein
MYIGGKCVILCVYMDQERQNSCRYTHRQVTNSQRTIAMVSKLLT